MQRSAKGCVVPQCNYELRNASILQEGTQDGTRICSVKFGIIVISGGREGSRVVHE